MAKKQPIAPVRSNATSKDTKATESNVSQPAETADGRLASKSIVERFSFQSLKDNKLQRHIERGCKLATQEELEDGDSTVSLTTGSTLAQTTAWKQKLAEYRTSEPYPADVNRDDEDERMDYDSDLANLSAYWFRAGELAERARDPQPVGVPMKLFDYRLGSDEQPLADAVDAAMQRVRDESDSDKRITREAQRNKARQPDFDHVFALGMAMRLSLRFDECIGNLPNAYAKLKDHGENVEFREVAGFLFRAGQLSGWR